MACRRAREGLKPYADQTGNYPREPETLGCASAGVLRTHHQAVAAALVLVAGAIERYPMPEVLESWGDSCLAY